MGGYDPTMSDDEIMEQVKELIIKEYMLQIANYQKQFMADDYVTPFQAVEEEKQIQENDENLKREVAMSFSIQ